jgi:hypothetical protein
VERSWVGARDAGEFIGDAVSDDDANGAVVGVIRDSGKNVGAKVGAVEASLVGARDTRDVVGEADSNENFTNGAMVGRDKDISAGVGAAEASLVGARDAGNWVDGEMSESVRGGSRHKLEKFTACD